MQSSTCLDQHLPRSAYGPTLLIASHWYCSAAACALPSRSHQTNRLPQGGSVDVRIKWPNDLYAGPMKIGGVLCHSSYRDKLFYVIMGVGLNVTNREPTTCVDALLAEGAAARGLPPPAPVTREASGGGVGGAGGGQEGWAEVGRGGRKGPEVGCRRRAPLPLSERHGWRWGRGDLLCAAQLGFVWTG